MIPPFTGALLTLRYDSDTVGIRFILCYHDPTITDLGYAFNGSVAGAEHFCICQYGYRAGRDDSWMTLET